MSTSYEEVFDSYLSKIDDPIYTLLSQDDAEFDMLKLLNSAIVQFNYPKVDLRDKDDDFKQFNQTLGLDEIEILSSLMKLEKFKRDVNRYDNIRQKMQDKDFRISSQASHLEALIKLKREMQDECNEMQTKYSFRNDNGANFTGLSGGI